MEFRLVFFANSGAGRPLERMTEQAGSVAMEAASEMWGMISRLEDRAGKSHRKTQDLARSAASKLLYASLQYGEISKNSSSSYAINFADVARIAQVSFDLDRLRLPGGAIPVNYLYQQLSKELYDLAQRIQFLELNKQNESIREAVFEIMGRWEKLSSLARLIAAGNAGPGSLSPRTVF